MHGFSHGSSRLPRGLSLRTRVRAEFKLGGGALVRDGNMVGYQLRHSTEQQTHDRGRANSFSGRPGVVENHRLCRNADLYGMGKGNARAVCMRAFLESLICKNDGDLRTHIHVSLAIKMLLELMILKPYIPKFSMSALRCYLFLGRVSWTTSTAHSTAFLPPESPTPHACHLHLAWAAVWDNVW